MSRAMRRSKEDWQKLYNTAMENLENPTRKEIIEYILENTSGMSKNLIKCSFDRHNLWATIPKTMQKTNLYEVIMKALLVLCGRGGFGYDDLEQLGIHREKVDEYVTKLWGTNGEAAKNKMRLADTNSSVGLDINQILAKHLQKKFDHTKVLSDVIEKVEYLDVFDAELLQLMTTIEEFTTKSSEEKDKEKNRVKQLYNQLFHKDH